MAEIDDIQRRQVPAAEQPVVDNNVAVEQPLADTRNAAFAGMYPPKPLADMTDDELKSYADWFSTDDARGGVKGYDGNDYSIERQQGQQAYFADGADEATVNERYRADLDREIYEPLAAEWSRRFGQQDGQQPQEFKFDDKTPVSQWSDDYLNQAIAAVERAKAVTPDADGLADMEAQLSTERVMRGDERMKYVRSLDAEEEQKARRQLEEKAAVTGQTVEEVLAEESARKEREEAARKEAERKALEQMKANGETPKPIGKKIFVNSSGDFYENNRGDFVLGTNIPGTYTNRLFGNGTLGSWAEYYKIDDYWADKLKSMSFDEAVALFNNAAARLESARGGKEQTELSNIMSTVAYHALALDAGYDGVWDPAFRNDGGNVERRLAELNPASRERMSAVRTIESNSGRDLHSLLFDRVMEVVNDRERRLDAMGLNDGLNSVSYQMQDFKSILAEAMRTMPVDGDGHTMAINEGDLFLSTLLHNTDNSYRAHLNGQNKRKWVSFVNRYEEEMIKRGMPESDVAFVAQDLANNLLIGDLWKSLASWGVSDGLNAQTLKNRGLQARREKFAREYGETVDKVLSGVELAAQAGLFAVGGVVGKGASTVAGRGLRWFSGVGLEGTAKAAAQHEVMENIGVQMLLGSIRSNMTLASFETLNSIASQQAMTGSVDWGQVRMAAGGSVPLGMSLGIGGAVFRGIGTGIAERFGKYSADDVLLGVKKQTIGGWLGHAVGFAGEAGVMAGIEHAGSPEPGEFGIGDLWNTVMMLSSMKLANWAAGKLFKSDAVELGDGSKAEKQLLSSGYTELLALSRDPNNTYERGLGDRAIGLLGKLERDVLSGREKRVDLETISQLRYALGQSPYMRMPAHDVVVRRGDDGKAEVVSLSREGVAIRVEYVGRDFDAAEQRAVELRSAAERERIMYAEAGYENNLEKRCRAQAVDAYFAKQAEKAFDANGNPNPEYDGLSRRDIEVVSTLLEMEYECEQQLDVLAKTAAEETKAKKKASPEEVKKREETDAALQARLKELRELLSENKVIADELRTYYQDARDSYKSTVKELWDDMVSRFKSVGVDMESAVNKSIEERTTEEQAAIDAYETALSLRDNRSRVVGEATHNGQRVQLLNLPTIDESGAVAGERLYYMTDDGVVGVDVVANFDLSDLREAELPIADRVEMVRNANYDAKIRSVLEFFNLEEVPDDVLVRMLDELLHRDKSSLTSEHRVWIDAIGRRLRYNAAASDRRDELVAERTEEPGSGSELGLGVGRGVDMTDAAAVRADVEARVAQGSLSWLTAQAVNAGRKAEEARKKAEAFRSQGLTARSRDNARLAQLYKEAQRAYEKAADVVRGKHSVTPLSKIMEDANGVMDEETLRTIFIRYVEDNPEDWTARRSFNLAIRRAIDMGVEFEFVDGGLPGGVAGDYRNGRVRFDRNFFESGDVTDSEKAQVLFHDVLHGALWQMVHPTGDAPESAMRDAALQQLRDVLGELRHDERFRAMYGARSVDELMSEMSNPAFCAMLRDEHRSWWRKFLGRIFRAFGIENESRFERVRDAMEALLTEPLPERERVETREAEPEPMETEEPPVEEALPEEEVPVDEGRTDTDPSFVDEPMGETPPRPPHDPLPPGGTDTTLPGETGGTPPDDGTPPPQPEPIGAGGGPLPERDGETLLDSRTATPERVLEWIDNESGFEPKTAVSFVEANIKRAQDDVKKHKPPKDMYRQGVARNYQDIHNALEAEVRHWEAVMELMEQRMPPTPEREARTIREALSRLGDYLDLEDYVMRSLAGGGIKFKWRNNTNGTKGLGAHLGKGDSERERRGYLWAVNERDGYYPEEVAERLLTGYSEETGIPKDRLPDDGDVLSMVLDAMSYGSARRLLDAVRERHSERDSYEDEAERRAAEEAAEGRGFDSVEEMEAYDERLRSEAAEAGRAVSELDERRADEEREAEEVPVDGQGNPVDGEGRLAVERIGSVDELTDEDFTAPRRSVELPDVPEGTRRAIGAGDKPIIIKKNIFEKNRDNHPELDATQNRTILKDALYSTNLYGQTQPKSRPNYWVAIRMTDPNRVVVLEVSENKDNVEIVGWRYAGERQLEELRKQAEREDGQLLILTPEETGAAAGLSTLPSSVSGGKGSESSSDAQAAAGEKRLNDVLRDANRGSEAFQAIYDDAEANEGREFAERLRIQGDESYSQWLERTGLKNARFSTMVAYIAQRYSDDWHILVALSKVTDPATARTRGYEVARALSEHGDISDMDLREMATVMLHIQTKTDPRGVLPYLGGVNDYINRPRSDAWRRALEVRLNAYVARNFKGINFVQFDELARLTDADASELSSAIDANEVVEVGKILGRYYKSGLSHFLDRRDERVREAVAEPSRGDGTQDGGGSHGAAVEPEAAGAASHSDAAAVTEPARPAGENNSGNVGEGAGKDVPLQPKSEPEVPEEREVTREEIESLDLDDSIKDGAMAYLDGEDDPISKLNFLIAQEHVRSKRKDSERGGGDAGASQLGSEGDGAAVESDRRGDGGGGRVDTANDTDGAPAERSGGADSASDVAGGDGASGDSGVSANASRAGGRAAGGDTGERGKSGRTGDNGGRGRGASGPLVSPADVGREARAAADADLSAALDELKAVFDEPFDAPVRGKLLAVDPVTLFAGLGAVKAGKIVMALTKVASALVRKGYYKLEDWFREMRGRLGGVLRERGNLTDEQIDDLIKMMWDSPISINGVRRKVREWASLFSEEELRKAMRLTIDEKRKLQKEAESVATIDGDINNIRESLPFLLPKQQDDVQLAERQFFDESHKGVEYGGGKGYMFTNGTGTGKTYTGLGIIKRFLKRGRGRVLIVTAQETKIKDWIADALNLGIEAHMLTDTKDKGEGVVVTQYANMRQNSALLEDEFDLIVYDESHKLMENKDGEVTTAARFHHMLSNRDERQAARRIAMSGEFGKAVLDAEHRLDALLLAKDTPTTEWSPETIALVKGIGGSGNVQGEIDRLKSELDNLEDKLEEEVDNILADPERGAAARAAANRTKVVFLSATPFNTPANLDYAEGYIFSYDDAGGASIRERDRLARRDRFLIEQFPSSHQRNKNGAVRRTQQEQIADPSKANEEEIAFSDRLQQQLRTMSGRNLDSEFDYSRDFPKLDFEVADTFNDAIQSLSDGRYNPLKKYFKHLLNDYNTMTGYLEIFKAQMIAPRIREYIDLGYKVTLYHRRKATNADMVPPFALAMEQALKDAEASPAVKEAVSAFQREFARLFAWEQTIDYIFPQESIVKQFMTASEWQAFDKAKSDWQTKYGEDLKARREHRESLLVQLANIPEEDKSRRSAISKLIAQETKAIEKIIRAYPKPVCAMVGVFNGTESETSKRAAVAKFNDDSSPMKLFVAQVQSAKEGISLHDTTGKYPRVQIGIFLPQSPIEFIQTEGRIFRVGNKSNAVFEYPLLGLDIELSNFAQKINGRSETTENLALGSAGRGLRESIARAVLSSRSISPKDATGVGGKELDTRKTQEQLDFESAMRNYAEWRDGGERAEGDIADPIGYMLSQWGRSENGERVLVPRAGNGTVARYVSPSSRLTALEQMMRPFSRLSALVGGSGREVRNDDFGEYPLQNKADVVLLNALHGREEETSGLVTQTVSRDVRDVAKALRHLEDSGRLVALVEGGSVSQIRAKLSNATAFVPVCEIKLPGFVLDGESASVMVIDYVPNGELRDGIERKTFDLSDAKDEQELFARLGDVAVPERTIDKQGKISKRVRPLVSRFVSTGCIASTKNYSTKKMEPEVINNRDYFYVSFANGKMSPSWFRIKYQQIAAGDANYIMRFAKEWVEFDRRLQMDDDALFNEISYGINYKRDRLPGVRDCYRLLCQAIEQALGKTPMQIRNIAAGRVENEVRGSYDVAGFREMFDSLNPDDAGLEALADKVFAAVGNIEGLQFRVKSGAEFKSSAGHNVAAHFAPALNAIELNGDVFNSVKVNDKTKAQTLVHEMIHAVSVWAIEAYKDNTRRHMLTAEQQQACRDILDVYEAIKDDPTFRNQLRRNGEINDFNEYGLTNEHEMMAELSNPVFRAALKAKKLWRQLINGVKMLLGLKITGDAEEADALSVLDKSLDTLMNTFDGNVYKLMVRTSDRVLNAEIGGRGGVERRRGVSGADRAVLSALVERLRGAGVRVVTDAAEGQRVLDAARRADAALREMRVWHGSGADFDRFDHSHMGEGEGAQAYGWGTYVTQVEGIARGYANTARRKPATYKGLDRWHLEQSDLPTDYIGIVRALLTNMDEVSFKTARADMLARVLADIDTVEKNRAYFVRQAEEYATKAGGEEHAEMFRNRIPEADRDLSVLKQKQSFLRNLDGNDFAQERSDRYLYDVEIPNDRAAIEKENSDYNAQLDAFGRGELNGGVIRFGQPSGILRACGMRGEILMLPKKLKEHLDKHGLSIDDVRDLPKALRNPLLVYEWGTEHKSTLAVTELETTDGRKLTVAIRLGQRHLDGDYAVAVDEIVSIHGKEAERMLREFIDEQNRKVHGGLERAIKYVKDKEKVLEWLGLVPPQGTASMTSQELSVAKVIQNFKNPSDAIDNFGEYLSYDGPVTEVQVRMIAKGLTEKYQRKSEEENFKIWNTGETGREFYNSLSRELGGDRAASEFLRECGFVGIEYPANYRSGGNERGDKNYVIFNEADAKITGKTRFFRTEDGEVYGFVRDGVIYLDPRVATSETAVHEHSHLWSEMLRQKEPEAWRRLVDVMRGERSLWEEVRRRYPELESDDDVADEVFAHYSGRRGAERLREEMRRVARDKDMGIEAKAVAIEALRRVGEAVKRFWREVARMLGFGRMSAEDFADWQLSDLLNGTPLEVGGSEGRTREMFVGERGARGLDASDNGERERNRSVAEEMEKGGKDARAIKLATGWERGKDGKWRYEVPEFDEVSQAGNLRWLADNPDAKRYLELLRKSTHSIFGGGEALSDAEGRELDALRDKFRNYDMSKPLRNPDRLTLADFVRDGRLFTAYPELRDVRVKLFDGKDSDERGYYSEENDPLDPEAKLNRSIGLNAHHLRNLDDFKKTLAHEVQHAVQAMEGFAKGDDPARYDDLATLRHELQEDKYELIDINAKLDDAAELGYNDDTRVGRYTVAGLRERKKKLETRIEKTEREIENYIAPYDRYQRSAGEVEARNASRRMGMSVEERRGSLAEDTEDVPRGEQIVRFGNGVSMSEVKDDILDYFHKAARGEVSGRGKSVGKLTKEGKQYLEQVSGLTLKEDVDFILNPSDLRHIYKNHYGANEKDTGNNKPLTDEDIRNLATVATQPERVIFGIDKKTGNKVFLFLSSNPDGTYNLAEVYTDRRGNLTAKSFYNSKKTISQRVNELLTRSPRLTSATEGVSSSSNAKVPKLFELAQENIDESSKTTESGGGKLFREGRWREGDVLAVEGEGREETRWTVNYVTGEREPYTVSDGSYRVAGLDGEYRSVEELCRALHNRDREHIFVPTEDGHGIEVLHWTANDALRAWRGLPGSKRYEQWVSRVREQACAELDEQAKKMGVTVRVIDSLDGLEGRDRNAKGWYDPETGEIVIVLPNHNYHTMEDVMQTLFHEAVGHYGLRELFGGDFDTFLDNVYNSGDSRIRDRIAELTHGKTDASSVRRATEEYLSQLAEDVGFHRNTSGYSTWEARGIWDYVKGLFIDMLRKAGFSHDISDNELKYVLWKSYDNLRKNARSGGIVESRAADINMQYRLGVGNYGTPLEERVAEAREEHLYRLKDEENRKEARDNMIASLGSRIGEVDNVIAEIQQEIADANNGVGGGKQRLRDAQRRLDGKQRLRDALDESRTNWGSNENAGDMRDPREVLRYWDNNAAETRDEVLTALSEAQQALTGGAPMTDAQKAEWETRRRVAETRLRRIDYQEKSYPAPPYADATGRQPRSVDEVFPEPKRSDYGSDADYQAAHDDWETDVDKYWTDVEAWEDGPLKQYYSELGTMSQSILHDEMRLIGHERVLKMMRDFGVEVSEDEERAIFGFMKGLPLHSNADLQYMMRTVCMERRRTIEHGRAEDRRVIEDIRKAVNEYADRVYGGINRNTYRRNIYAYLIDMVEGTMAVPEGLQDVVERIRNYFEDLYQWQLTNGVIDITQHRENYVPHVWDLEKSVYPEGKSLPNPDIPDSMMAYGPNPSRRRHRVFATYQEGENNGMVRKHNDIFKLMFDYSRMASQEVCDAQVLELLKNIEVVTRVDEAGEAVETQPLVIDKENKTARGRYGSYNNKAFRRGGRPYFYVNDLAREFMDVMFGEAMGDKMRVANNVSAFLKSLKLSCSGFHHLALTEHMAGETASHVFTEVFDMVRGTAAAGEELFKPERDAEWVEDAASHFVKLGMDSDLEDAPNADVFKRLYEWLDDNANEMIDAAVNHKGGSRFAGALLKLGSLIPGLKVGADKFLWDFLHDGYKLRTWKWESDHLRRKAKREGWDEARLNRQLDELGQVINDMFGGQHFDILGWKRSTLNWSRLFFLSIDWNTSWLRLYRSAAVGGGGLYQRGSMAANWGVGDKARWRARWFHFFKNWIPLWDGEGTTGYSGTRARMSKANLFLMALAAGAGYSIYNYMQRKKDMEEMFSQNEAMREAYGEDYKNPYEQIGVTEPLPEFRWANRSEIASRWKEWMPSPWNTLNSPGKRTYLFNGRDSGGRESYIRWGKQVREPWEMFDNDGMFDWGKPLSFAMGKANPAISTLVTMLTGEYNGWENKDITEPEDWYSRDKERLRVASELFTPFSFREMTGDGDWRWSSLVMPTSKGMGEYAARELMKKAMAQHDIAAQDHIKRACALNGIDVESVVKYAKNSFVKESKIDHRDERFGHLMTNGRFRDMASVDKAIEICDNGKDWDWLKDVKKKMMGIATQEIKFGVDEMTAVAPGEAETNDVYASLANATDMNMELRLKEVNTLLKSDSIVVAYRAAGGSVGPKKINPGKNAEAIRLYNENRDLLEVFRAVQAHVQTHIELSRDIATIEDEGDRRIVMDAIRENLRSGVELLGK